MKTILIRAGILSGIFVLLAGIWVTNNFIYPFSTVHPNYSDVEKAFSRLQFPAAWQEISSSENRGLHGRGCDPLNSSGCFHKSKTFIITDFEATKTQLKTIFLSNGCKGVAEDSTYEGNSNTTPKTLIQLSCQINGGVIYGASISQQRGEASVVASTN